jgi:hypothetical protein
MPFWPNNARLAVSVSLMYEGGGQPISGAPGVIPDPVRQGLPDMPTNGVFQYGICEGTPRLLGGSDCCSVEMELQRVLVAGMWTPTCRVSLDRDMDLLRKTIRLTIPSDRSARFFIASLRRSKRGSYGRRMDLDCKSSTAFARHFWSRILSSHDRCNWRSRRRWCRSANRY